MLGITDGSTGRNQRGNRDMTYDGLDRLKTAISPMWGGGTASYIYDALDNLVHATVPATTMSVARNWHYCYDTTRNQIDKIRVGTCSGALVHDLAFDVQGNVQSKDTTSYGFDFGNRLRTANGDTYRYDAHGRRVRTSNATSGDVYSLYGQGGQLFWSRDERDQQRRQYVYLSGSLIAEHSRPIGASTETVTYQHTDALGSPTVRTSQARAVIERVEYEPYGKRANLANDDRPGYTGHVMDATTGLTYMQQRYYDPGIGMFLSVDPVTAFSNPVGQFHRYRYANNNPYKFTDPDGREVKVELRAYTIGNAPLQGDYGHQYVYLRDTESGATMISRAGPSSEYPGGVSDVVSGSPVRNPGGDGNVTLVTELGPTSQSADSNMLTGGPRGSAVEGSQVIIEGTIDEAANTLQTFNNKVDAAKIDYKPLSTNSNAYAGTAYKELTGKAPPTSDSLPGSDVDLKRHMDPPL